MRIGKKGEGMTLPAIIGIVLGISVLVFMIFGFSIGWGNFMSKITNFGGGESNVDDVVRGCEVACASKGEYNYCETDKVLDFGDGRVAEGSCSSLGDVSGVSISCSGIICKSESEAVCEKNGADISCGDWESRADESVDVVDFSGGAGDDLFVIPEANAQGRVELLKNCKSILRDRKKLFELPSKLCYWEAMAEVYYDKCKGKLSRENIDDIFKKKRGYREADDSGWPDLKDDEDFCVPVIYDCDAWPIINGKPKTSLAFFNPSGSKATKIPSISGNPSGEIQVNPYYSAFNKEGLRAILFHEGIHSISSQISEVAAVESYYFGKGFYFIDVATRTYDKFKDEQNKKKAIDNLKTMSPFVDAIKVRLSKMKKAIMLKISERTASMEEEFVLELINYYMGDLSKEMSFAVHPDTLKDKNRKIADFLKDNGRYDEEVRNAFEHLQMINDESYKLYNEYFAKGYVGKKIEIDARLSDVHRWWLDQTADSAGGCEIIYTPEKAREVLDLFLEYKDLDDYMLARTQLKLLLDVYREEGQEDEVYYSLTSRLPQLASVDNGILSSMSA